MDEGMNRNNMGRFTINGNHLQEHPDEIAEVFSQLKIVPVHVEYHFETLNMEYMAIGECFEEIKEMSIVPWYRIEITSLRAANSGIAGIKAEAIKENREG